ncbi:M28 family peptidase [Pedobacter aquatilis]|uniref:M28 family metallopeptidase n=1 Tax=Pedobacter aquatilis TaxID=351343 RepID=UPI0025B2F07E|nr:M28 family peptidase [Pedobacter aquatilis]MDN3585550.1 M28 family peptidase [Pedobacter aquatilis]
MHIISIRKILLLLFLINSINGFAQDSTYTRNIIKTLTSKSFWGRGYTKDGMAKAANFLSSEYKKIGVSTLSENYKQDFTFAVNTFPGKMNLKIDGKKLVPGVDFIVEPSSNSINAIIDVIKDSLNLADVAGLNFQVEERLTWSVAQKVQDRTTLIVKKSAINQPYKLIEVDIENKFLPDFKASNIVGIVKGTKYPDSVLMITAHYDHLGGMGSNTYFPGANDNAAGVATLLSLAKYYAANPQSYSIGFICFAAEEAGLLGSKYFVENPIVPLSNIKFLLNLDLVGTGEAGMTVVNASVYPKAFALLNEVNQEQKLISKINPRGKAANSDHYFFSEKGVPAFFFYTQGGPTAYHDVFDTEQDLPLTEYNDLFKLIISFNKKMME